MVRQKPKLAHDHQYLSHAVEGRQMRWKNSPFQWPSSAPGALNPGLLLCRNGQILAIPGGHLLPTLLWRIRCQDYTTHVTRINGTRETQNVTTVSGDSGGRGGAASPMPWLGRFFVLLVYSMDARVKLSSSVQAMCP